MPQSATIIANPTSGGYSATKIDAVARQLLDRGFDVETRVTATADDARRFAEEGCRKSTHPFFVVAGGDGTINGVLNGLVPGVATMAILPLGTANVLAQELGITSFDGGVGRIFEGRSFPVSAGLVEGAGIRRYFMLMAGVGIDGAVVEGVNLAEKKHVGKAAYALSALRLMSRWDSGLVEVDAEGRTLACHSVVICNSTHYGGGFRFAPRASLESGTLEIFCVTGNRIRDYFRVLTGGLGLGGFSESKVVAMTAREITIGGTKPMQLDGDYLCHTPCRISVVENYVRLIR